MIFSQNQVWAAAVAAQRINGEYVSRPKNKNQTLAQPKSTGSVSKLCNTALVKIILNNNLVDVLASDYIEGQKIRTYFCCWISLIFTDEAKSFFKAVVNAASLDEMNIDCEQVSLIATLPSIYEVNRIREQRRKEIRQLAETSVLMTPGLTGQRGIITLEFTVLDSKYDPRYCSWVVNGIVHHSDGTHSMIFFFDSSWASYPASSPPSPWSVGETITICVAFKKIINKTTQYRLISRLK